MVATIFKVLITYYFFLMQESLGSPILIYPNGPIHYLPQIIPTSCRDTISNFSGVPSSIDDYCIYVVHRTNFFPTRPPWKKGQHFLLAGEGQKYRHFESKVRSQPLRLADIIGIACISNQLSLPPVAGWGLYTDTSEGHPSYQTGLLTRREANTQHDKIT